MSTTYKVNEGDTFDSIARKVYGVPDSDSGLARSNPGVTEPLQPGTVIIVPDLPNAPKDAPQELPANDPDETVIRIDSTRFRFWTGVTIRRELDSFDTIELSAPFEPEREEFRERFMPFSYKPIDVSVGGPRLFTGTMVNPVPEISQETVTLSVSGYSKPGVLNDCNMPASAYPLEFNNQSLRGIAETLAKPFGLAVEFDASPGAVFKRVSLERNKTILTFLADLAKERGFVIGSTEGGALAFRQPAGSGSIVARLREGESPVTNITPQFNPQEYYSHVTGVAPSVIGLAGDSYTRQNSKLQGVLRPHVYEPGDSENADLSKAVAAKIARMFGNAVSYTVDLATWRDPTGELWAPNTRLTLTAPGAMIYNEYEFIVRSVELRRTETEKTATLGLVLPESFSSRIPERMPWEE